MKINHFLPFVPAKDFKESRNFYSELGFEIVWEDEDLVRFRSGYFEFFLQNYYVKEFAENLMIHLNINHFSETFEQVEKIVKHYTNCKLTKPKKEDYGLAFKLTGPSGELWDIVEGTQHY
jgi:predicted lactoylglutathione lyase